MNSNKKNDHHYKENYSNKGRGKRGGNNNYNNYDYDRTSDQNPKYGHWYSKFNSEDIQYLKNHYSDEQHTRNFQGNKQQTKMPQGNVNPDISNDMQNFLTNNPHITHNQEGASKPIEKAKETIVFEKPVPYPRNTINRNQKKTGQQDFNKSATASVATKDAVKLESSEAMKGPSQGIFNESVNSAPHGIIRDTMNSAYQDGINEAMNHAKQGAKHKKGKGNSDNYLTPQDALNEAMSHLKQGTKHNNIVLTPLYCTTCSKTVCSNHYQTGHSIFPFQQGIREMEMKEMNNLKKVVDETENCLKSEMHINDVINLWNSNVKESLHSVFKNFEESSSQNTEKMLKLTEEGNMYINNNAQAQVDNLMQLINLQNFTKSVISEGQQLTSHLQGKPYWLIFSWFKISIGLILQSGNKIFSYSKTSSASQYAPFELQGDRILLYSLRSNLTPNKDTILMPLSSVESLFERDDFYAFMKISYNKKSDGCLFIRLDKETFWGNQFMALCSGVSGPSLRTTRFFRSCGKGKPGHHVWGGDYIRNDGSGGKECFKWNRPLVYNPKPITRGLIASRPGVQDKSSIFRIYLRGEDLKNKRSDEIEMVDKFSFGQVIDGLESLAHMADMPDISMSKIEDTGRFLSLT